MTANNLGTDRVFSALSEKGEIVRLVLLLELVRRLGEEQALPEGVAARLLLTRLSEMPQVVLYRPGLARGYCRRVTEADEFGVDSDAAPRFEVHRYADSTTRIEIATGQRSERSHSDLRRSGERLPSVFELEERPPLRGRAGALKLMQRLGIGNMFLVEEVQAILLLAPEKATAQASAAGKGKWPPEREKALLLAYEDLKRKGDEHAARTVAADNGCSVKVIHDHLRRARATKKAEAEEAARKAADRLLSSSAIKIARATKWPGGPQRRS